MDGGAPARIARRLQLVLVVLFVGFAISTVPGVRSSPGFVVWLDGWYQGTAYVLIAALALLRPLTSPVHRLVCSFVAAAIVLRVAAFLWYWVEVRTQVPQPYPSLSDVGWILSAVCLLAAVVLRAGELAPLLSRTLLLDALAGALLVGGASVAVLFPLLDKLSDPGIPDRVVVVNLAYPVLDIALLIASAGLLAVTRWRPRGPEVVLVVGVVLFAVVDATYLYLVSEGAFRPGTWISSTSFLATFLIASAGWTRGSTEAAIEADELRMPGIAVPVVIALLAVCGLAYAGVLRVGGIRVVEVALALLVLAVTAAATRGALTILQGRRLLDAEGIRRAQFQALVEESEDFIAVANLDYSMSYLNPGGRLMLGIPADRPAGDIAWTEMLAPEAQLRVREISGPRVESGGGWSGPSVLRHLQTGAQIPVAASTFMLHHPVTGEAIGMGTIQRDVRRLDAAERALDEVAEQRRVLLARLVEAQEEERAQIAEDVHDDPVQALAAVDLRLGMLRRELPEDSPLADTAAKAHEAVMHANSRLRHLLFDLESPARDTDLAHALETAAEFAFEDTGVRWQVVGERDADLPEESRVSAYRIVKEALVNVRKHAEATQVEVRISRARDGVMVVVHDDGVGVDVELAEQRIQEGHHGLANMRDRATIAGGLLHLHRVDDGTEVRLWLPDLGSSR